MKNFVLKLIFILLITTISFCSSLNNRKEEINTITGTWIGNYSWKCLKKGNEKIMFKIIDKNGVISGKASFSIK